MFTLSFLSRALFALLSIAFCVSLAETGQKKKFIS